MDQPTQGRVIASRYRLERMIARGGMGSVWAAFHLGLDTPVAVKFMEASLAMSGEARARFEREAKAAAQLRTPHVVHIHDHGVDGETPYIVMELLKGEDLGARLRRAKRLGLPEASRLAAQAARALRVAHAAGIVHRDLKPGNVFLARNDDDEDEVVKLLDFGIAKSSAIELDESTKTGELLGSPDYMSPEQARHTKRVDARSDLWSLAVILYRAVTGKKPFVGETVGDLIVKICTEPATPPSAHVPTLPSSIDPFFEKALAKSPTDRFQSAKELADAFAVAAGVGDAESSRGDHRASIAEATPSLRVEASTSGAVELVTGDGGAGTLTSTSSAAGAGRRGPRSAMLLGLGAGVFAIVVAIGTAAVLAGRDGAPEATAASGQPATHDSAPAAATIPVAETAAAPGPPPVLVEPSPSPVATTAPSASASGKAKTTAVAATSPPRGGGATPPPAPAPSPKTKKKPNFGY